MLLVRLPPIPHVGGDAWHASPSAARTRGAAALGGTSSLAVCGASLRHETTAVTTLLLPIALRLSIGGCRRRAGQVSVARQGQGTGSDWGDGTTGDRTGKKL